MVLRAGQGVPLDFLLDSPAHLGIYSTCKSRGSFNIHRSPTAFSGERRLTMEPIQIDYKAKSDVAGSSCGVCTNFQPVEGSESDGNCFGNKVVAEGLCNFFDPLASRVEMQAAGRLQESV